MARKRSAINTAVAGFLPASATVAAGGIGGVAGARAAAGGGLFQTVRIMAQAAGILSSPGMRELENAAASRTSAAVEIAGRTITYDPAPFSGFTNFAGRTFHLGNDAFSSRAELTKTVLQELFRLSNGAGNGASAATAASETRAAFNFAEKAYSIGTWMGIFK